METTFLEPDPPRREPPPSDLDGVRRQLEAVIGPPLGGSLDLPLEPLVAEAPVDVRDFLLDPPPTEEELLRAATRRRIVRWGSLAGAAIVAVVLLVPAPGGGGAGAAGATASPEATVAAAGGEPEQEEVRAVRVDVPPASTDQRAASARSRPKHPSSATGDLPGPAAGSRSSKEPAPRPHAPTRGHTPAPSRTPARAPAIVRPASPAEPDPTPAGSGGELVPVA